MLRVDLAQALLAVDVVAVLRPVAVARGPADGLDDLGTLGAKASQLSPESGIALWRDVTLGRHSFHEIVVSLWFLRVRESQAVPQVRSCHDRAVAAAKRSSAILKGIRPRMAQARLRITPDRR